MMFKVQVDLYQIRNGKIFHYPDIEKKFSENNYYTIEDANDFAENIALENYLFPFYEQFKYQYKDVYVVDENGKEVEGGFCKKGIKIYYQYIVKSIEKIIDDIKFMKRLCGRDLNAYNDLDSAVRILNVIADFFDKESEETYKEEE